MTALAPERADGPRPLGPGGADGTDTAPSTPLPRHVARLLHSCSALAYLGVFTFYVRVWLSPREGLDALRPEAAAVVDGTADAPFQYRFLVPRLLMWAHRELGWQVGFAEVVLDLVMLAIAVTVTAMILRRLDLEVWVLPIALYASFVMVGTLWWGKFETFTSFAAMSVMTWAILRDDRRRWLPMAVAVVILAGTRTDLLFAASIALLARWLLAGRRGADLTAGIVTGASGLVATIGLMAMYPDATYGDTALVQIAWNLKPDIMLTAVAFLLPAIGPYLLIRSQPEIVATIRSNRAVLVPILTLVVAQVGSVLIVGRVEEVRLFVPITTALGIVAVFGWRALLAPYATR